jgi:isoleucyl-tRNA synthetase
MGIEGQVIHIFPGMVSFQAVIPPHVVIQEFSGGMVFMDTSMTEETKAEGFASEVIRIVLEARKELAVEDSHAISMKIQAGEELQKLLGDQREYIMEEVNATDLAFVRDAGEEGYVVECEIRDESFTLAVLPESG